MRVGQSEIIGTSVDWPQDRCYGAPVPADEYYAEMGCGCGI
mgnify:FL=1|jgi:hypothetical protein